MKKIYRIRLIAMLSFSMYHTLQGSTLVLTMSEENPQHSMSDLSRMGSLDESLQRHGQNHQTGVDNLRQTADDDLTQKKKEASKAHQEAWDRLEKREKELDKAEEERLKLLTQNDTHTPSLSSNSFRSSSVEHFAQRKKETPPSYCLCSEPKNREEALKEKIKMLEERKKEEQRSHSFESLEKSEDYYQLNEQEPLKKTKKKEERLPPQRNTDQQEATKCTCACVVL